MNKMKDRKLFFCMFLLIFIFVNISFVSSYVQSNAYSSKYNNAMGLGIFTGGQSLQIDESMCQQGTDFLIQIAPLSCEPIIVTSDLLEEENVNVFCKMTAIKINPLIDVTAIDALSFDKQYPREVLSIGYQPAQAALGRVQGGLQGGSNLQGSLFENNLGYVVITLRRQPNESALTNCQKTPLGNQVCWVEGNITATLKYDVQNAFGVGSAVFYLPEIDDNSQWEEDYIRYGFWDGRGYLRALSIDDNSATVAIYSDNQIASSVLSGKRTYSLARYSSNIQLTTGKSSDKIFLPGLTPCLGSFQLQLLGVEDPDTVAKIRVNEQYLELKKKEKFLDNACQVKDIIKSGLEQKIEISCRTDSGADSSTLIISPQVNLSVGGKEKYYKLGDRLYNFGDRSVYLGYIGSYNEVDAYSPEDLYVYLVALPNGQQDRLTKDQLDSVSTYASLILSGSNKDSSSGKFSSAKFNDFMKQNIVGGSLKIGKEIIQGQEFVVVDKKTSLDFLGTKVSLIGLSATDNDNALIQDTTFKEYYDSAMEDLDKDVNSYPSEIESPLQTFGERALKEEIDLASKTGQYKTMLDLCQKFAQDYPKSFESLNLCRDKLALSNSDIATQDVTINTNLKTIYFDGISEPSLNQYSATLTVKGPKSAGSLQLRKNTPIKLDGFKSSTTASTDSEYVTLEGLDTNTAKINVNLQGCQAVGSDGKTSGEPTKTGVVVFTKGVPQTFCGYTFTVTDITLNKVAKVSIIPGIDLARSSSTFDFKIGVEKRAIQLSPEKAKQKIIEINKTVDTLEKITKYLGGVVKTMKLACTVTEAGLTWKNLVAGRDGKATARQTVMTKSGGWNDWCDKQMHASPSTYKSLNDCFLKNSDKIESDVNTMASTDIAWNKMVGSNDLNSVPFLTQSSNNVYGMLSSNALSGKLSSTELADLKKVLSSTETKGLLEKGAYNIDTLKNLQTYASYLANDSRSGNLDYEYVKNLKAAVADITRKSQDSLNQVTFEEETKMPGSSFIMSLTDQKMKFITIADPVLFVKTPYIIDSGWTIDEAGSTNNLPTSDLDYALAFTDSKTQLKYLVRYNRQGIVIQTYQIYSADKKIAIYKETDKDGKSVNNPNPFNLQVNVLEKSAFSNDYKSSYGDSEPLVIYFDAPYQNKPAVVPFDLKEGWYAGIDDPANYYDSSGQINQFWICNVGSDRIESFQVSTPRFGGDNCIFVPKNRPNDFTVFGLPNSDELIRNAKSAIEAVQNQYKNGVTEVYITNLVTSSSHTKKTVKVGAPASQTSSKQCTDYWPVKDCVTLFNVCDPVICPSSRCDFGGKYHVNDVIQSGIIGSIALCWPNAKWNGGDVYVPICLSGVNAGLESLTTVFKARADCLQKSIDTGETVGICDEINSIYLCEFFWKQSLPLTKLFYQRFIDRVTGEGAKGGGEYRNFAASLKNAQASVDYFTQYYAANSYRAFKVRSTEEVGSSICGGFASIIYPSGGNLLDRLISPDSPFQFLGKFEETVQTTTTNPPTSHYKVWYHIYAGTDSGAYYSVYLRSTGTSYYQDTMQRVTVKSGYIARGGYADETRDFTAPSGYSQLCINVNGREECGFKEVSTSFAVNYISDLYLKDQVENTNIKTQDECISGTASLYSILDLNLQSAAENMLNPELVTQGINRICASQNPGLSTNPEKWKQVGICDDKTVGCWIDMDSVKNAIKTLNISDDALDKINKDAQDYLSANYMTPAQFEAKKNEINSKEASERITLIDSILRGDQVFYNNQKAYLYLQRGLAYGELALKAYEDYLKNKEKNEQVINAPCQDSIVGDKIISIATTKIGQDTTRLEQGNIVYDNPCATFVSNVLIEAGAFPQFSSCSLQSTPYRDAIVELIGFFRQNGYTEIDKADWKSNLKPGDLIIWGGSGSYDREYQHITIFSNYAGTGIRVIHDGGKGKKIDYTTYSDPFVTNWYITHVWRAKCVTGGTTPTNPTNPTTPPVTTEETVFLIKEKLILPLPHERNIYFKFENGKWMWSMGDIYHWEDTSGTEVTSGDSKGKSPEKATRNLIEQLDNLNSNIFEIGKLIIKNAGGTDMYEGEIKLAKVTFDEVNYVYPALLFEDGKLSSDVCFKYIYPNKWYWTHPCVPTRIADYIDSVAWIDAGNLNNAMAKGLTDKSIETINFLKGKNYLEGLNHLIERTKAGKSVEGGTLQPDLADVSKTTKMNKDGLFTVDFGNAVYFDYSNSYSTKWKWTTSLFGGTKNIYWAKAGDTTDNLYEDVTWREKRLVVGIEGKTFLEGAAILFDPTSEEVLSISESSFTKTPGGGVNTVSLDDVIEGRTLAKLTDLMNSLSSSNTNIVDRKCVCAGNCDYYASLIASAAKTYNIPDELLLLAIMIQESSCNPNVEESSSGDVGLMQINVINCVDAYGLPENNEDQCVAILSTNERKNIDVGAHILKDKYNAFNKGKTYTCNGLSHSYTGWEAALRGYNGWGGKNCGVPTYVEDVKYKYFELVSLYG
jgi:hypothetical protein